MFTRVLSATWRLSSHFRRPSSRVSFPVCSPTFSRSSSNFFEPLPKKELVTTFKSRLREREFLPGASSSEFPEFLGEPTDSFPLGVAVKNPNRSSLADLTVKCMEFVEDNFSRNPAILFRGLPAKSAEDFSVIARAIPYKTASYGGIGHRSQVDKDAGTYTASERPPKYTIELHNELAYSESFPSKVYLFCVKEPGDGCGGETPIMKNNDLQSRLDPDIIRKLDEKQIKYQRYMPSTRHRNYISWQDGFMTKDRKEVEELAKQQGNDVRWDERNGDLFLSLTRSAFIPHPVSGEKYWFNLVTGHHNSCVEAMPTFNDTDILDGKWPYHSYYGDGSEIEPEVIQHIRAQSWACAVGFKWKCGDLLVIDNVAAQHGRIGFSGERKVLAYLTA